MNNISITTIMDEIVRTVSASPLFLSNVNADGRINSVLNETAVISTVERAVLSNKTLRDSGIVIRQPRFRSWFDFSIEREEDNLFVPVNVKLTDFTGVDNLSCKMGIYYALTGIRPDGRRNEAPWADFLTMLHDDLNTETDQDYYFLIVNKSDTADIFWTSLKSINVLTANGSNLPFQADWSFNRNRVARTHEEACNYLITTMGRSLDKRALPSTYFHSLFDADDVSGRTAA